MVGPEAGQQGGGDTEMGGTSGGKDVEKTEDAGGHGAAKMQGWQGQLGRGGWGTPVVRSPRTPGMLSFEHSAWRWSGQQQTEAWPVSEKAARLCAVHRRGLGGTWVITCGTFPFEE